MKYIFSLSTFLIKFKSFNSTHTRNKFVGKYFQLCSLKLKICTKKKKNEEKRVISGIQIINDIGWYDSVMTLLCNQRLL